MKILLAAVNAKFIHSNPALYSLSAYAGEVVRPYIEIAEYTINNKTEEILADIYCRKPDVIAFSCYIWNIDIIKQLINELPKVLNDADIWLGGPEASNDADTLLKNYQMLKGVMIGEGEETFRQLAQRYCNGEKREIYDIDGIAYRDGEEVVFTGPRLPVDISKLPFLYDDMESFGNRIIYYESSRGCPYRCSYCLSSIDKTVRFRDISVVKRELKFFLDKKVKQVKFVDRTFNCNKEHALEIWKFLLKNDNGVTNFHFEIAADILDDDEIEVLSSMRAGLIQLEIGVQTTNPDTLREIRRISDMYRLKKNVGKLVKNRNIHIHLDLIAGLPFEDYESFVRSFNEVYAMQPNELQLGFLKVLKGSYMYEKAKDYGLNYTDMPPYEVLSTKWLTYDKLIGLKMVEDMLEIYYNSSQFVYTLPVLQSAFDSAFEMYEQLARFYRDNGYMLMTPSRIYRYQALLDFAMRKAREDRSITNSEALKDEGSGREISESKELYSQLLTFDLYLRENAKSRPEFVKDLTIYKRHIHDFYEKEERDRIYLPSYRGYDVKQISRMTHMEVFDYPVWEEDLCQRVKRSDKPYMVLFDYSERSPVTHAARFVVIDDFIGI